MCNNGGATRAKIYKRKGWMARRRRAWGILEHELQQRLYGHSGNKKPAFFGSVLGRPFWK